MAADPIDVSDFDLVLDRAEEASPLVPNKIADSSFALYLFLVLLWLFPIIVRSSLAILFALCHPPWHKQ